MTAKTVHNIIGGCLFGVMLVIYLLTVAPTLSFWDCGEFISCSYIMGIPHPPGSPLLSLIGRVFTLIPFYDFRGTGLGEIAYRVNLIDVLLGALTVMLTYFIMVRLIRKFRPPTGKPFDEAVVMFSAAITALVVAFSDEFWSNAVETETYMPSIFMSMLAVWLTLRWDERSEDPRAVRYLFLSAYLVGLGNGVHLTVLLIAPTLFLLVLLTRPSWFSEPKLWLYTGLFMLIAALIKLFAGMEILYISMALFAFVAPYFLYRLYRGGQELWKIVLLGMLTCGSLYILGFSVYPTVMVRAYKDPVINEGDPDTWNRYKLYMSRDQYGQENMYIGMFTRNAEFKYQFGYMYLRYLIQQFPKWGPSIPVYFENNKSPDYPGQEVTIRNEVYISVLLLSLLVYGLFTHCREDWKRFFALMLFFIASSIGLVLYLNMKNPQVRERAYFFLGSYYIIIYWIGMGVYGVIVDIRDWLIERKNTRLLAPITVGLFVLIGTVVPSSLLSNHLDPNYTNYEAHNRTGDWAPWDYGYNILISCDENAILFTNGDNDTFPLWYLQEVKGVRKDVRVINLSLINTDWYILQMKHEGVTVPVKFSDDYVRNTLCGRDSEDLALRVWPLEGEEVEAAGIKWKIPSSSPIQMSDGTKIGMIRIQDVMVFKIIDWVNWTRPIYFAVTVAQENKSGLDNYLSMEGMVYRLVKTPVPDEEPNVNIAVLDNNIFNRYQYRSLTDDSIYKPPNTVKLVTNYFIGFAQLAERYLSKGDTENAKRAAAGALEKTTNDLSKRILLYRLMLSGRMNDDLKVYLDREISKPAFMHGREGLLDERLQVAALLETVGEHDKVDAVYRTERDRLNLKRLSDKIDFGSALLKNSLDRQAYAYFDTLTKEEPNNIDLWKLYTAALYATGKSEEAVRALDHVLELAPGDKSAINTRRLILQQLGKIGVGTGDSSKGK